MIVRNGLCFCSAKLDSGIKWNNYSLVEARLNGVCCS